MATNQSNLAIALLANQPNQDKHRTSFATSIGAHDTPFISLVYHPHPTPTYPAHFDPFNPFFVPAITVPFFQLAAYSQPYISPTPSFSSSTSRFLVVFFL